MCDFPDFDQFGAILRRVSTNFGRILLNSVHFAHIGRNSTNVVGIGTSLGR